ncbi:MAG: hypothetical protein ACKO8J_04335, partial [Candidatus Limnocylindrus sp.]
LFPGRGGIIGGITGGGVSSLLTPIGGLAAWSALLIAIALILAESTVRRIFTSLFGGARAGALASAEAIARGVEELAERREQAQRDREAARANASVIVDGNRDESSNQITLAHDPNEGGDEAGLVEARA